MTTLAQRLAKNLRSSHFGENWIGSNLQKSVADLSLAEATTSVRGRNSIALLLFHINYYVSGILDVMRGGPLVIRDKYSFDMPPLETEEDWQKLQEKCWADAEAFAQEMEKMSDEKLWSDMADPKYGSWHQNLIMMLEHIYYHVGQVAMLKQQIRQAD